MKEPITDALRPVTTREEREREEKKKKKKKSVILESNKRADNQGMRRPDLSNCMGRVGVMKTKGNIQGGGRKFL